MTRLAWAVALAVAPTAAHANAGIGYFLLALPIVLVALLPAIPLEALVLWPLLRVPLPRAMMLSLGANIRSTLWGLGLGIVADFALIGLTGSAGPEPTKGAATAMLVPLFFFSWWIEHRAVARRAAEIGRRRIALATGAANLLSYAAMTALVWGTSFVPERGSMSVRVRMAEPIAAGASLKAPVEEYWGKHKRFPGDLRELGAEPPASQKGRAALEPQGVIAVTIDMPEAPEVHDKRILITPVLEGGTLRWTCTAPGIELRYVPPACRGPAANSAR